MVRAAIDLFDQGVAALKPVARGKRFSESRSLTPEQQQSIRHII
jgi:hypothetical protein